MRTFEQRDAAPLAEILEPARSGHQHLGAVDLLGLLADRDAAVGGRDPQATCLGDRGGLGRNLRGELAGGYEDQRRRAGSVGCELLDHRNRERQRLARTGGRLGQDVLAR